MFRSNKKILLNCSLIESIINSHLMQREISEKDLILVNLGGFKRSLKIKIPEIMF